MEVIFSIEEVLALALQVILVIFLLRGPFRKYLIVFLYSTAYLLTSVSEVWARREVGKASLLYSQVYWTNEIVLDLLLFLMVILLTAQATKESPLRKVVSKLLIAVVLIAFALPFVIPSQPYFSLRWFRFTAQILNFGGVIMNLGLWTALIATKHKDSQLLSVSAGLGVAVTGQAIYYGLRLMTSSNVVSLVNVVTYVAGVAIWCWAFRPATRAPKASAAPVIHATN
jgi:hypothetical protein